jgi:tRNA nucleotidyltransferase (CCA-adding enzyme)
MKIYEVGGAVRDELLGLPVKDRDFVVVGSTPEEMTRLGYTPVGKDFPVFLHPKTHAEYALARTERKTARGYHGFQIHAAPDVTLEQDLLRRDLTINAIAKDEHGNLIDPQNGAGDLREKILRHVSAAFSEDPVRVLRVARFAARFSDFDVAPETMRLMRAMAANGEVDALVAERVWQELAKGLMESKPSRMFEILIAAEALTRIVPEFSTMKIGDRANQRLDRAAHDQVSLPIRYAVLVASVEARTGDGPTPSSIDAAFHDASMETPALSASQRLRVPSGCADLAKLAVRWHGTISRGRSLPPEDLLKLLLGADALRRPTRFRDLLSVSKYLTEFDASREIGYLLDAQTALAALQTDAVISNATVASEIPQLMQSAQLEILLQFIATRT